jgi:hypothetical protein
MNAQSILKLRWRMIGWDRGLGFWGTINISIGDMVLGWSRRFRDYE